MSTKNLAREVESIALALSEENGYEYYHIDDELRKLAKDVSDMQAENAKLRELCEWLLNPYRLGAVTGEGVDRQWCRETYDGGTFRLRELGIEVDA